MKEQIDFGLGSVINPFKNELVFEVITTNKTNIDVLLMDLFGKQMKIKKFAITAGVNSLSIENTEGLTQGIYILQVKNNDIIINKKVLKR